MAQTKVKLIAHDAELKSFELLDTVVSSGETFNIFAPKQIVLFGNLNVEQGGVVDIENGASIITFDNYLNL